jgi:RNA-binding protein with serine-rich domain 1
VQAKKPADNDMRRRLHISKLTRNVEEAHLKEIFGTYGTLTHCQLAIDERVHLPKGYAIIEYETREQAETARDYMDGGQIDGNLIQ